ncbi:diguanylate cyclase (GGDEF)-like protein [Sinobacterium caligoides]|uniref:Diguanylate cyclase (GGDEF)-like protein n=1 Tax=Sinobacterium caligoides TaxID=933926 RepID=A0A3N2DYL4_9GAMM|nr:GGDEF domain-containing protein [Sinobacterium caligoides]ROS04874.1 diguanylate cyclase (GGDEF)-like protein [Sinobacterium caligoides]
MNGENSPLSKFVNRLDALIPEELLADSDTHYRARTLVGMLISYSVIASMIAIILIATIPFDSYLFKLGAGLTLLVAFTFVVILYFIKRCGKLILHTNITVATFYAIVVFSVWIAGGPITSPSTILMSVPPILALCLLDRKYSIAWCLLCASTLIALLVLEVYFQYSFLSMMDSEYQNITRSLSLVAGFTAIVVMALINDSMSRHYKSERDAQHRYIEHMANHDALTGLVNRSKFDHELETLMQEYDRRCNPAAIVLFYIDLNGFKRVNDQYGHAAGDHLLQVLSQRLAGNLRDSDIIGRLGGDEFALVSPTIRHKSDITTICNKLLELLKTPVDFRGQILQVSGSIGVATAELGIAPDQLKHFADEAMYHAKREKLGWHYAERQATASSIA